MEALLVAVICSPRRVCTSAPAFASFHLHRLGRTWSSVSLRWRMLYRRSRLADALPQSSRWFKLLRTDALLPWLFVRVDALPPFLVVDLCTLIIVVSASRFSCRVLVRGVSRVLFVFCVLLCCCSCCRCVVSFVCIFFFSVFFSFLCSCVGQALLDCIKIVSITASFLMKNVLSQVITSQSN